MSLYHLSPLSVDEMLELHIATRSGCTGRQNIRLLVPDKIGSFTEALLAISKLAETEIPGPRSALFIKIAERACVLAANSPENIAAMNEIVIFEGLVGIQNRLLEQALKLRTDDLWRLHYFLPENCLLYKAIDDRLVMQTGANRTADMRLL